MEASNSFGLQAFKECAGLMLTMIHTNLVSMLLTLNKRVFISMYLVIIFVYYSVIFCILLIIRNIPFKISKKKEEKFEL